MSAGEKAQRPRGKRGGRKHGPQVHDRPFYVGCPDCGAEPGEGCVNAKVLTRDYHDGRYLAVSRIPTLDSNLKGSRMTWPDRKQISEDNHDKYVVLTQHVGSVRIGAR
jgi:hypothetical protein